MFKVQIDGIDSTIESLERWQIRTKYKTDTLLVRLADIGIDSARVTFSATSFPDNPSPVSVYAERTKRGVAVIAEGEQVAFIEFGAGVFYNGSESYAGVRPSNIAKIGEYGNKRGKGNTWGYYDANHQLVLTHGNPPANAMWYASEDMVKKITEIAQEVFSND